MTEGVTLDSEIPAGLPAGGDLEIEILPELEIEISQPLAGLDENCEGFNEETGEPFPFCEEPLVCEEFGENFGIFGANKYCTFGIIVEPPEELIEIDPRPTPLPEIETELIPLAGLGENCAGFNEETGEPFPKCQPDFVCEENRDPDLIFLPGRNFFCTYATGLILPEEPIEPLPCLGCFGEEARPDDDLRDLLLSEDIQNQLRTMTGFDFDLASPTSYRSQVVAGTNYIVKFRGLSEDMQLYFLALINEPLPGSGE